MRVSYRLLFVFLVLTATVHASQKDDAKTTLDESLHDKEDSTEDIDSYYGPIYQCDTLSHGIDHYDLVDTIYSRYQQIDYFRDAETNDTCFHLDDVYQMCGCYWPHYHEMVVHKTAKYINQDVKRVLWVGGGDSGLLNEIIKYPTLELVVGLELDQMVTRGAFKHFGMEPHYDNEKVQWWYGDASKSLLMLPKDYFGSFDMVLVDLSDTVFALSVTKELDVVGALSLLLRPGGIFEINELSFESVSNAFQHTMHYGYQDVPKVCDQSLIMGSNDVNFLQHELTTHDKLGSLLVEQSSHRTKHRFDMVHDYRRNDNSSYKRLCERVGQDVEQEPEEQEASPGILMVLEVENVSGQLDSTQRVKNVVVEALQEEGLHFLSSFIPNEFDDGVFAIVLREGYVMVRIWPEHNYCGFDIHLWSSFDKHEAAKKALIKSVGGEIGSTSSYRIVAGGMFGVSTWKNDARSHGPQVPQVCTQSETPTKPAVSTESNLVSIAVEEGLNSFPGENLIVAVLCGYDTEPCESIDLLKSNKNILEVVELRPCPDMKKVESFDDFTDRLDACQKEVLKQLQGVLKPLTDGTKLQAIVVDKSAPPAMCEIVDEIFDGRINVLQLLAPEILVMATIEDKKEVWRRTFVNHFRKEIIKLDPVSSAHVFFKERDMEMDITFSGDTNFIQHLNDMVLSVEKKTGVSGEIRSVVGGLWRRDKKFHIEDSETSQYFLPGDLSRPSLDRWKEQKPLGHQTVLQLEHGETFRAGEKVLGAFENHGTWFLAEIRAVNNDNTYHLAYDDGDEELEVPPQRIKRLSNEASQDKTSKEGLSLAVVEDAFKHALSSMESEDMSAASTSEFQDVGDGVFLVAIWSGGTVSVLWDGRVHVDIHLFTYTESEDVANEFSEHFTRSMPGLMVDLCDKQPRGAGRVVNFAEDIKETPHPYWAHA